MSHLARPILVTGLPRSGTSMVAGVFHACGAWTGTTMPGNDENPKGYFEHTVIRERVTKEIIRRLGHDPLGVKDLPSLNETLAVTGLDTSIQQIIARDGYLNDKPWLYKDAKLSLIWPAFVRAFPDACWVIVQRDPQSVIDSCLGTSFMAQHSRDRRFWSEFVQAYDERLDTLRRTGKNIICLQSEDIVHGQFSALQPALTLCGLEYDESVVKAFVCRDYWRA